MRELLDLKPDFRERGRMLIRREVKFPDIEERIIEGLAASGLELERARADTRALACSLQEATVNPLHRPAPVPILGMYIFALPGVLPRGQPCRFPETYR